MIQQNYQINDKLWQIGIIDDRKVPFHRLILEGGTTYNSYFYATSKPTVIDTVDMLYTVKYLNFLSTKTDLSKISYIIINHTEPDHSGALGGLFKKAGNAMIVCSEKAIPHLKSLYKIPDNRFKIVKTGDTLDIGGKTLSFFNVPNLHTEETMLTYCKEDKVLFPCDLLSTHLAVTEPNLVKYNKNIDNDFSVYYDLIFSPHRVYVLDFLETIKPLEIDVIAPSHGYIIDKDINHYLDIYKNKSQDCEISKNAMIVYSSLRGATKQTANYIKEKLDKSNTFNAEVYNADQVPLETLIEKAKETDLLIVGSSTKYGDMVGKVELFLKELPSLSGKTSFAFGTFGWSGEAIEIIGDYLIGAGSHYLTTSETIKKTGIMDYDFPIRVRYGLDDNNKHKIDSSIEYILSVMN